MTRPRRLDARPPPEEQSRRQIEVPVAGLSHEEHAAPQRGFQTLQIRLKGEGVWIRPNVWMAWGLNATCHQRAFEQPPLQTSHRLAHRLVAPRTSTHGRSQRVLLARLLRPGSGQGGGAWRRHNTRGNARLPREQRALHFVRGLRESARQRQVPLPPLRWLRRGLRQLVRPLSRPWRQHRQPPRQRLVQLPCLRSPVPAALL